MSPFVPPGSSPALPHELLVFIFTYAQLLGARCRAQERKVHPRQEALPVSSFRSRGWEDHYLRWMLFQAHVEHVGPVSESGGGTPALRESVFFADDSGVAMTASGDEFAELLLGMQLQDPDAAADLLRVGDFAPRYDRNARIFFWGRQLLKWFRQPAPSQELVLLSAEELRWPEWFPDPLPPGNGVNAKDRVHDTIKNLNRNQAIYLVRFKGDGTGTRFGWELR